MLVSSGTILFARAKVDNSIVDNIGMPCGKHADLSADRIKSASYPQPTVMHPRVAHGRIRCFQRLTHGIFPHLCITMWINSTIIVHGTAWQLR